MKTKNILSTTILALAGVVLSVGAAQAAQTYNNGDLLLSFRANGVNPGGSTDYVIDIGAATNFLNNTYNAALSTGTYATGALVNVAGINLGTDLQSIYGGVTGTNPSGNWYNRSDLTWSVLGIYKGSPTPAGIQLTTALITSAESGNTGIQLSLASPFSAQQTGFGSSFGATTGTMQSNALYYKNTTSNGGTTVTGAMTSSDTATNSYGDFITNTGNTSFTYSPETTFDPSTGVTNSVNDLYAVTGDLGNNNAPGPLGAFAFTQGGQLEYESLAPVPEPASAGLISATMLGIVALSKRRRLAASHK